MGSTGGDEGKCRGKEFDMEGFRARMAPFLENETQAGLFWDALEFAREAHRDQWRKSGDAYILHPCSTALVLAEELDVRDPEILAAALLHDTVEDCEEVTIAMLRERFGPNVAATVEGCTKVTKDSSRHDRQAFTRQVHRKIFSGAAARLEVILVKLADRTHNIRTLDSMPARKRQRIATETLDIYAPLATVLGLFALKRDLYDRALEFRFPQQSRRIRATIRRYQQDRKTLDLVEDLGRFLDGEGLATEVRACTKGLWAYYNAERRILVQKIDTPQEIHVTCPSREACYQALGRINSIHPPIPRTIRDFIANPKNTGYQALHARANIGGRNYLFKIRTREMTRRGQRGMVSQWRSSGRKRSRFERELQEMFAILGKDPHLRFRDLLAAQGKKELYTYTPRGDLKRLPAGSIVLDFAFAVHTEVGHTCTGAVINSEQRISPPDRVLREGDIVRIERQEERMRFEPEMQKACSTTRARHELAKAERQRRARVLGRIGRSLVEQEMRHYGIPREMLESPSMRDLLDYLGIQDREEFFSRIGTGQLSLHEVMIEMRDGFHKGAVALDRPLGRLNQVSLCTLDPVSVKLSRCCRPNPAGRSLIGLLSERGISLHLRNCRELGRHGVQREDAVEVRWDYAKTRVLKPQHLFFPSCSRPELMECLANAPEHMRIERISQPSRWDRDELPWEVVFRVDTLLGLREVLRHLRRIQMTFEFELEQ